MIAFLNDIGTASMNDGRDISGTAIAKSVFNKRGPSIISQSVISWTSYPFFIQPGHKKLSLLLKSLLVMLLNSGLRSGGPWINGAGSRKAYFYKIRRVYYGR